VKEWSQTHKEACTLRSEAFSCRQHLSMPSHSLLILIMINVLLTQVGMPPPPPSHLLPPPISKQNNLTSFTKPSLPSIILGILCLGAYLLSIGVDHCFCHPLALIVASPGTNGVHVTPVLFTLGMDLQRNTTI